MLIFFSPNFFFILFFFKSVIYLTYITYIRNRLEQYEHLALVLSL